MIVRIIRNRLTIDGVFGVLTIDDNPFKCFTCENRNEEIKPGTYKVTFDFSNRFNRVMPHVWVPDRDAEARSLGYSDAGIRIHWGNYPSDYEGCIGVGNGEDADDIDSTVPAFNQLFTIIKDQELLSLTITEDYPEDTKEAA